MFLSWKRYEDIRDDHTDDYSVIEAREYSKDAGTLDEEAIFTPAPEYEYIEPRLARSGGLVADPPDRELGINGETVLKVYQPFDESELLAAVAAILARHSNDENYGEIVHTMELVDPGERSDARRVDVVWQDTCHQSYKMTPV